jgi:hypothetical protein
MIVRISSEGQYRVEDTHKVRLGQLDEAVRVAADHADEARFMDSFAALLDYVRSNGERLADDDLEGSDIILPPPDMSLAEAQVEFTGEGLIPD